MGQPLEYALSSCVLAMRLAEELGLRERELRDVYYEALLRYIGCNAGTHVLAALFGDELVFRRDVATVDSGRPIVVLRFVARGHTIKEMAAILCAMEQDPLADSRVPK